MSKSDHAHEQFADIARAAAAGQLEPMPAGIEQLRIYAFRPVGVYRWAVRGDGADRRIIWVWQSACRWCGDAFYQTTSAWRFAADVLRMVNCPRHRGRPRRDAIVQAGKLTAAATKRKTLRLAHRERAAARADDPANHAAAFDAVRAHLANGGRLCMGASSPDYVGKRLRHVGNLFQRQIPGVVRHLIQIGALEVATVGRYPSGNKIKGLIVPKAPD